MQPHQLGEQALLAFNAGDLPKSRTLIKAFLKIVPKDVDGYLLLALVERGRGQIKDAEKALLKATKFSPNHPGAIFNLATHYAETDKFDRAAKFFKRAVKLMPGDVRPLVGLADSLRNSERRFGHGPRQSALRDEALTNYVAAANLQPTNASVLAKVVDIYTDLEDFEAAIKWQDQIVYLNNKDIGNLCRLAVLYLRRGQKEKALELCQAALDTDPTAIVPLTILTRLAPKTLSQAQISRLEEAASDKSAQTNVRIRASFGLGTVFDAQENYSKAFSYLERANNEVRVTKPYQAEKEAERFQRLKETFRSKLINPAPQEMSPVPIFIVGMPRSGTTLVEQILAAHSQVYGAGEISDLVTVVDGLDSMSRQKFPEVAGNLSIGKREQKREEYLSALKRYDSSASHISNKAIDNILYVGLIAQLFPGAPIIHCRRNPYATCFSCYQQDFGEGLEFSNSLSDLAHYYRLYADIMSHWRCEFAKDRMLELDYEEIVHNTEGSIRRLIAYCGLDWEENCLRFHLTQRVANTASMMQVRQPIHNRSVNHWRNYEETLLAGLGKLPEL